MNPNPSPPSKDISVQELGPSGHQTMARQRARGSTEQPPEPKKSNLVTHDSTLSDSWIKSDLKVDVFI